MRRKVYLWFRVIMVVSLIATLGLAGCAAPAQPAPSVSPSYEKTPGEGIQMHGHWTLEVLNPDGSVVERREFDNAITPGATGGSYVLVAFLSRQYSIGGWVINLKALQTSDSPFDDGNIFQGYITESSYPFNSVVYFKNLTLTVPVGGQPNEFKMVLSGTATANRNGRIEKVGTMVTALVSSNPPASSYEGGGGALTETTLASPVTLTNGQQINVTVVISFS